MPEALWHHRDRSAARSHVTQAMPYRRTGQGQGSALSRLPEPPLDRIQPGDDRGQPADELVGGHGRGSNGGASLAASVQQLGHLPPCPVKVHPGSDQDLRRDAVALANEAEQDVLGADVVGAD